MRLGERERERERERKNEREIWRSCTNSSAKTFEQTVSDVNGRVPTRYEYERVCVWFECGSCFLCLMLKCVRDFVCVCVCVWVREREVKKI